MKHGHRHWLGWLLGALLVLGCGPLAWPAAGDSLNWRKDRNRVDADISSWDLNRLLTELATATEWDIYVDPQATRTISTKFADRTTGDALRLLLGDLNFALVPQTNAPSRLYVFHTSLQEATRKVHARPKAKPIPNELIVTLKPGGNIDALARRLGAKVVGRLDHLNVYRLRFDSEAATEAARKWLQQDEQVASVDSNYPVDRSPRAEDLAMSSFPELKIKPRTGADANRIVVGLIDTAIHTKDSPYADFLLPTVTVAGEGGAPAGEGEALSHGDSMLQSMLRGLSGMVDSAEGTRVRILPVDIYGGQPATSSYEVFRGVYEAINGGATYINMSLSSDGEMPYLERLISQAHAQGVVFFAAAGNEPTTNPSFPAVYPEVIAVTAGTSSGSLAPYANRGAFVDAIAPGSMIVKDNQGAAYLVSGTSVASAYAAGVAAGLADRSGTQSAAIEASIRKNLALKPGGTR